MGGRPVGMGNDIVTTGAICRDIDVVMFTVLVNWINITILNTPGCICCNIECRDVYSACELDKYMLIQSVKSVFCSSLPQNWSGEGSENVESGVSRAICCGRQWHTHVFGVRCSEQAGLSRVKRCRRRISAVCVRKDNHWSVVKNSLVSTILVCLLSVVIKCFDCTILYHLIVSNTTGMST